MNILALCCALNNSYLAVQYEDKIYSEIIKSDKNYHSLYVISKIKELGVDLNKLDIIAANLGPGSFTGIRVTLSIAKVLAGELNLPLVGLNTAEILLDAFNKKTLIMDARRDMYYLGSKDKIELIYKDKIQKDLKDVLCDKRTKELFSDALCFEEEEKDLGKVMLKLAQGKYQNSNNKEYFNPLVVSANYIQTPPVF